MPPKPARRRVCFVTGTRAEFGLMASTLRALRDQPRIELQIVATGSHTQASRGRTLREIRSDGWHVDATIPWPDDTDPTAIARNTGRTMARLVDAFDALRTDVVLVVGDRVEAFAAASAAHVSGRVLAHVHGGDRAMGQVDDALRHAISKLAHVHFAATRASGERLFAMGEDRGRIHVVGAPGIDGIRREAASREAMRELALTYAPNEFVLLLLHPTNDDDTLEAKRAQMLLDRLRDAWKGPIVAVLPNSDPGSAGIVRALRGQGRLCRLDLFTHVSRCAFLGLLRDCRALVGNSSAGIIEAGSFGTAVVDVGPRQVGRERGGNVAHASWDDRSLAASLARAVGRKRRQSDNPYGREGAGRKIAKVLAELEITGTLHRKLIRY